MRAIILSISLLTATLALAESPQYVAHEWGTFTSVQGANGVQIEWNPLTIVDLPVFVHNQTGIPGLSLLAKTAFICRQRMETPVIYFYADQPLDVDVAIDFPGGHISEWYPEKTSQARLAEVQTASETKSAHQPSLLWEKVHVLPKDTVPAGSDLAIDQSNSHYYAARETDSNLVQTTSKKGAPEFEKFLFYRGTGDFQAPVTVKLEGTDHQTIRIENRTTEELLDLYLFQNNGAHRGWLKIPRLSPNETRSVSLSELTTVESQSDLTKILSGEFREALIRHELYPREAAAMVKTWEQSWFAEPGLRVLYPIARHSTDSYLPIHFTPAPKELVRVMVGRAEIITPEVEKKMEDAVNRYVAVKDDKAARALIADEVHRYGYGRFDEAIVRLLVGDSTRSKDFVSLSWELISEATALDRAAVQSAAAAAVTNPVPAPTKG